MASLTSVEHRLDKIISLLEQLLETRMVEDVVISIPRRTGHQDLTDTVRRALFEEED